MAPNLLLEILLHFNVYLSFIYASFQLGMISQKRELQYDDELHEIVLLPTYG